MPVESRSGGGLCGERISVPSSEMRSLLQTLAVPILSIRPENKKLELAMARSGERGRFRQEDRLPWQAQARKSLPRHPGEFSVPSTQVLSS